MNRLNTKFTVVLATSAMCMVTFASVASAHVTVSPKTSTVGAWEKYTMRVPTEKSNPTEKIVLKIPSGITLEQYEPVPGWSVTEQKSNDGTATSITWTATTGGIAPGQFQEFSFVAQNPKSAENAAWNAFQYYQDKSIVEWTGEKGSQTPHSITDIMAATQNTGNTASTISNATTGSANNTTESTPSTIASTNTPIWSTVLSVVAILLSLGAIFLTTRKKRN